ncbi:hypothetical protein [Streptomyces phaeochromogenes]|uniref:hypothetical protein n=1 Tax=Streptomyces phaeochromogenes TaxID=1923 RepID=UPI00386B8352|nr:hypothetical protein OG277_41635 [Streptomyces phaeochromogenes]
MKDGNFTATAIIAPVVVTAIGLGIAGGFSWIGDQFKEDKPPLYVSGSRSPRIVVSTKPGAHPSDSISPSVPADASLAPGASSSSSAVGGEAEQSEAEDQGISYLPATDAYLCPWQAWVVNRPPSDFDEIPVLEDGSPDPELINGDTAGDPANTHLAIYIQSADSRPLQVKELRIKILERKSAPAAGEATLVGLHNGQCGGGPSVLSAYADLDGGADFATVRFDHGGALPQELVGGRSLSINLTVETRTCDCVWVPEIVWAKDGEVKTTEFRIDGKDFRTIATIGLERRAWRQDLNTLEWSETVFDESILE